jgi:hypothetical protein
MELLLLLLELQQHALVNNTSAGVGGGGVRLTAPLPVQTPFPLLSASLVSQRTAISDPLRYLQMQSVDILVTIGDDLSTAASVQGVRMLPRAYQLYNLCQCLSACLHEALSPVRLQPPRRCVYARRVYTHSFLQAVWSTTTIFVIVSL